jgi:hypothetical protein
LSFVLSHLEFVEYDGSIITKLERHVCMHVFGFRTKDATGEDHEGKFPKCPTRHHQMKRTAERQLAKDDDEEVWFPPV